MSFGGGGGGTPSTTTTTATSSPWSGAQPALTTGLEEAQRLFGVGPDQSFQQATGQSTVVPFSPQTEQSLTMRENLATEPGGVAPTAVEQARNIMSGEMLNANPYLDKMFDQAAGRVRSQVGAHFAGSPAENSAERYVMGEQLNDLATGIYGENYARERGAMDNMIRNAPTFENLRYAPAERLAEVGATREAQGGAELQEDLGRFNFEQGAPWQNVLRLLSAAGGGTQGGSSATTQPVYSNPAATYGGLGLGLIGALSQARMAGLV